MLLVYLLVSLSIRTNQLVPLQESRVPFPKRGTKETVKSLAKTQNAVSGPLTAGMVGE